MRRHTLRSAAGIRAIVRSGLCHGCGACAGICPAGTLQIGGEGFPRQVSRCLECNRCVEICSGVGVDFQRLGEYVFGEGYTYGDFLGKVLEARVGHATDLRVRLAGASGGVVSALLVHLLKTKEVDAVVVSRPSPANLFLSTGLVARTPEEIITAAGSHYSRSSTMTVLADLKDRGERIALVGLPCHIHALRTAQSNSPPEWRNVVFVVGLFCHFTLPPGAVADLAHIAGGRRRQPVRICYRDKESMGWPFDGPRVFYADGSSWTSAYLPSEVMSILGHLYPLGRCLLCVDATAEFADLSVGDPWIRKDDGGWKYTQPEGNSVILIRTDTGRQILHRAESAGAITSTTVEPSEVLRGQYPMFFEKKVCIPLRIRFRSWWRLPVPDYGTAVMPGGPRRLFREVAYLSATALFRYTPLKRLVLRFMLTRWGARLVSWRRRQKELRAARRRESRSASG